MKIRIKFSKTGALRYIGHLDVLRYFQKAIRRSGIPAAYSAGFSPHMIMSFAEPLSVGLTSTGEYFDLELTDDAAFSSEEIRSALNAQMAEGISVLSVKKIPQERKSNAMSLVAAASYTVSFPFPEGEILSEKIEHFMSLKTILAEKKTKSGTKTVDIRPMLFSMEETEPAREKDDQEHYAAVRIFCASGSAANLKPDAVMDAFLKDAALTADPFSVRTCRNEMYARGEDGTYLPLDALGESF